MHTDAYTMQISSRQRADVLGQLKPVDTRRQEAASAASLTRHYRYDQGGQLGAVEDSRRGRISYQYDPVCRLLHASSRLGTELFAFDPAGNIAPGQPERTLDLSGNATYPKREPIPKLLDNLLREYAGKRYRYDERGNLIERIAQGRRSEFRVGCVQPHDEGDDPAGHDGLRVFECREGKIDMGMMICERHGEQLLAFTSPKIAKAINDSTQVPNLGRLRRIDLSYLGVMGRYRVDEAFLDENNVSGEIETLPEERSEGIFEKLVPVCRKCLSDLLPP